ncbi:hypothetical protein ADK90_38310 [Streptomyces sp. XY413]|uniref:hypothetical protein n=1 Tax=Streptomyces sp. XY413 TaxID=1519479 RepID=UPI0006ADFAC4|nr:hypothetical protein [Streptomyces sp. XY413]KOV13285.1 hypothetical protein ADK90_38310 [Streptomyces sp. XY413]
MEPLALRNALLAALQPVTTLESRAADGTIGNGLAYGIVTRTGSGAEAWWQMSARTTPESRPTVPALAPEPDLPASGPVATGDIELLLAHALLKAGAVTAARYSTADNPPALKYGVHAEFEDETAAFLQLQWALRSGEEPREHTRNHPRDEV